MANCVIFESATDPELQRVIEESFQPGGSPTIRLNLKEFPVDVLKILKNNLATTTSQVVNAWGQFSPMLGIAISNYLVSVGFENSVILEEWLAKNGKLDLPVLAYVNAELLPIMKEFDVALVTGELATYLEKLAPSEQEPRIASLKNGLQSIFSNSEDISWFTRKYRNALVRLIFFGSKGIIKTDGDFSLQLLEYLDELVESLRDKVLELLENKSPALTSENLDIKNLLDSLDGFTTTELVDEPDKLQALNELLNIVERYYSSLMVDGKFYTSDIYERLEFADFIMLKNFDSFIELYLGDMISIAPGYKNSYAEVQGGSKYRLNIAHKLTKDYDDSKIEDISTNSSRVVQLYITSLPVLGTEDSYISFNDFNLAIITVRNLLASKFGSVRSNPEELPNIWKEVVSWSKTNHTIQPSVRAAIATIYRHVFDPSNPQSVKELYKFNSDTKYNLYSMIINLVSSTSPYNYVQTNYNEDGELEVLQLEAGSTTNRTIPIENNIVVNALKVDYNTLLSKLFIQELKEDNKLVGYSIPITGKETLEVRFKGDTLVFTTNDKKLVGQTRINYMRDHVAKFRELFSTILHSNISIAYWDALLTQATDTLPGMFDLMVTSLLAYKFRSEVYNPNPKKETLYYLELFLNFFKYDGVTLGDNMMKWFSPGTRSIKPGGIWKGYSGLLTLAKTNASITGELSKTYIIDANGNKRTKMGLTCTFSDDNITLHKLTRAAALGHPFADNIYYGTPNLLGNSYIDLEGVNRDGVAKTVATMTSGELTYHDFVHRYLISKGSSVYVQPSVYSDKSRIWIKLISTNVALNLSAFDELADLNGKKLNSLGSLDIHRIHRVTMGRQYAKYRESMALNLSKVLTELGMEAEGKDYTWLLRRANLGIKTEGKYSKITEQLLNNAIISLLNKNIDIDLQYLTQYTVKNGIVTFGNNMFSYLDWMYNHQADYDKKMKLEKALYAWTILDSNTSFDYLDYEGNEVSGLSELNTSELAKEGWVNLETKRIIPYKVTRKGVPVDRFTPADIYDPDLEIELHPEFDRYFALNNLLTDSYNATLFGFPYGHKGGGADWEASSLYSKEYLEKIASKDYLIEDIMSDLTALEKAIAAKPDVKVEFNADYLKKLKFEEAARTSAMWKRGVIGGATMRPIQLGLINGIRSRYKIACIEDISAEVINVHNTSSKERGATPHDGSIYLDPFTAILEANSLAQLAIGPIHRKPISHFDRSRIGVAGLLKCATFALNNDYIRKSKSEIVGRDLLRKMSDIKWNDPRINMEGKWRGIYYFNPTDFKRYQLTLITRVDGFNYNTTVQEVDEKGRAIGVATTINTDINSNYDLWATLGGEYSMSKDIDGTLVFGEKSVEAVVEKMNSVMFERPGAKSKEMNLSNFVQPMKEALINYLANVSAVKNGAGNINPSSKYYKALTDGLEATLNTFSTIEIDTDFLGIQLNAEHDLADSTISEMTLVMSAMEQGGFTHDLAMSIYINMGRTIGNLIAPFIKDVTNEDERHQLYLTLGRQLLRIYGTKEEGVGLTQAYIQAVANDISSNASLTNTKTFIPFDDPNIAKALLTGFTSGINKDVIRRQFDGIAAVQAPSHDLVMIYTDINGNNYRHEDLLLSSKSLEEFDAKLAAMDVEVPVTLVQMGDYILVRNAEGIIVREGRVNGYRTASFMGYRDILDLRGTDLVVTRLGSKGRNLRGQISTFKVGEEEYNTYDLDSSRLSWDLKEYLDNIKVKSYEELIKDTNSVVIALLVEAVARLEVLRPNNNFTKSITSYLNSKKKDKDYKTVRLFPEFLVLKDMELLQEGLFVLPYLLRVDKTDVTPMQVTEFNYTPNEMMLGKLWESQFRLSAGDKLSDITSPQFFVNKLATEVNTLFSASKFTAYYTRPNGLHLYIATHENLVKGMEEITPLTDLDENGIHRVENGRLTYKVDPSFKYYAATSPTGKIYDVILVQKSKLGVARTLLESSREFTTLQINPTTDSYSALLSLTSKSKLLNKEVKAWIETSKAKSPEDREASLVTYNENIERWKADDIQNTANKMFLSFKLATKFITARIPSQSMQSFMNTLIVGFSDSNTNIVWLPIETLVWQGSDYDIDKAFILGAHIDRNGIYTGWSDLFDYSSTKLFELSNKLPIPSARNPLASFDAETFLPVGSKYNLLTAMDVYLSSEEDIVEKEEAFAVIVAAINKATDDNLSIAWGKDELKNKEYLEFIDRHFNTSAGGRSLSNAIKNKIYYTMWESGTNLSNWVAQTTPITTLAGKDAANESLSGEFSKYLSIFNPAATFVALYLNSVGKLGIGINATGIKAWSMLLTYYHDLLLHVQDPALAKRLTMYKKDENGNRQALEGYDAKGNKVSLKLSLTAPNMNWDLIRKFRNLKEDWTKTIIEESGATDINAYIKTLEDDYKNYPNIPEDVFGIISILVTLSTDLNAESVKPMNSGDTQEGNPELV